MCPNGVTCRLLFQWARTMKIKLRCWSSTKRASWSSYHRHLTCLLHDVAGKSFILTWQLPIERGSLSDTHRRAEKICAFEPCAPLPGSAHCYYFPTKSIAQSNRYSWHRCTNMFRLSSIITRIYRTPCIWTQFSLYHTLSILQIIVSSFFLWPLYCLSFDLRIHITPLTFSSCYF